MTPSLHISKGLPVDSVIGSFLFHLNGQRVENSTCRGRPTQACQLCRQRMHAFILDVECCHIARIRTIAALVYPEVEPMGKLS